MKREILLGILMVSCIVGNWGRWSPLGIVATGCLYGAEEVNHDKPYPGDHGIQYEPAQSEHHIPGGR